MANAASPNTQLAGFSTSDPAFNRWGVVRLSTEPVPNSKQQSYRGISNGKSKRHIAKREYSSAKADSSEIASDIQREGQDSIAVKARLVETPCTVLVTPRGA